MAGFRVTFSKDDVLIYISHLDLNHAFIRALNRAGVELKFSQGFNPHPKLVFALPLSVGMSGENELLDIGVEDESMTAQGLYELLSKNLPPHITIKSVVECEGKFKDISAASYEIEISKSGICDALTAFLGGEISVMKKTKGGEKLIRISDGILSTKVTEKDGKAVISAVLCASDDNYLNPELIMKGAKESGIISDEDAYTICRKAIHFGKDIPKL